MGGGQLKDKTMNRQSFGAAAAALAASVVLAGALPLGAAPLLLPDPAPAAGLLQQASYEQAWKQMPDLFNNGQADLTMHGDLAYLHGYRGYRYPSTGFREYKGWWFPEEAFGTSAKSPARK